MQATPRTLRALRRGIVLTTTTALWLLGAACSVSLTSDDARLAPYLAALDEHGRDPVDYVVELLRNHDLLLFDDGQRRRLPARAPRPRLETTEGLGRYGYRWGRMEDGLWDSAFHARDDRPVALPLAGTTFGAAAYVGNHMHQAAPGQTMADAYDGLIFLAPLESLHQCAKVGEIYTPQFLTEAARRYRLLYTPEQIADQLAAEGVDSVEELLAPLAAGEPRKPSGPSTAVGSMDAWKQEQPAGGKIEGQR